jgi:hypothetical protein
MLDWLTHNGQASAASNGYVPLPAQIQQLARTMLQQITGPAGTHLPSEPGNGRALRRMSPPAARSRARP